jgi:Mrp family chromosome partitioning ATPase
VLGVNPPKQLREFFETQTDTQDLFFSIGVDNLLLAGQTAATDQASELLASNRFEELMGYIRQSTANPIVLIDLPPVLVTDDALVLAPRLDALLVVASVGKTGRTDLQKAVELLSEFPLAGLVLNRSVEQSANYAYGYGIQDRTGNR